MQQKGQRVTPSTRLFRISRVPPKTAIELDFKALLNLEYFAAGLMWNACALEKNNAIITNNFIAAFK